MKAEKHLYFIDTVKGEKVYRKIPYGSEIKVGINISEEKFQELFPDISLPKKRGRKKKVELCMQ